MAINLGILKSLLQQGAVQGGKRAITSSGGNVVRAGAQGAAPGIAGGLGGVITSYAVFDLIGDLLGGATRTAGNVVNPALQAVTGNSPSAAPTTGDSAQKYAVPQINPLAYENFYRQEQYRRELLARAGIDLGTAPARPLTQMEAYNLNQLAMQRAGQRERELARVQGELAALPAAFQTQGQIGQSTAGVLNQAIATVLQRAPVEKSQALQAIATKQQF